jgi:hypothetical protein
MKLQNILDIEQFSIKMSEGMKSPLSSYPWFQDCIGEVVKWICQDHTTTIDDLREKAENYVRNYLAIHPELSINKDEIAREVADEIERKLEKKCFDKRPIASVLAQMEREKIPEDPEEKFIKLGP